VCVMRRPATTAPLDVATDVEGEAAVEVRARGRASTNDRTGDRGGTLPLPRTAFHSRKQMNTERATHRWSG
jgi:hypothetical protein